MFSSIVSDSQYMAKITNVYTFVIFAIARQTGSRTERRGPSGSTQVGSRWSVLG
jgi:hypothetical protein